MPILEVVGVRNDRPSGVGVVVVVVLEEAIVFSRCRVDAMEIREQYPDGLRIKKKKKVDHFLSRKADIGIRRFVSRLKLPRGPTDHYEAKEKKKKKKKKERLLD